MQKTITISPTNEVSRFLNKIFIVCEERSAFPGRFDDHEVGPPASVIQISALSRSRKICFCICIDSIVPRK